MKRILIVDDSSVARLIIRSTIPKDKEYIIDNAANCDEALERAKENLPDLVLCDYNMPGKNGVEVCKAFKEAGLIAPFILVTANLQQTVRDSASKAGFVGTIKKPFDKEVMRKCLEENGL